MSWRRRSTATPCDVVVVATPIDLGRVLKLNKPSVRVGYEIEEITKPSLARRAHASSPTRWKNGRAVHA